MPQGDKKSWPVSQAEIVAFGVVILVLAWIYADHVTSMADNWWNDPNYSHGILVPLVSAYLIVRQSDKLHQVMGKPNALGFIILLGGLFILAVGYLGSEFFLKRISLIPVLWSLVFLGWGWPMAKRLAFPFAYLIFMIPLPYVIYDSVAFPLRLIAASLAGGMLHSMGTPSLVEGNVIHLPYIVLNVVDACSGIRSLISLLAAGSILAYLMLPNRWSKVLLVLLVFPVAVLTNAFRVVAAGILAKYIGMEAVEGSTHDFVGWAVFMVAFAMMALLTALLRKIIISRDKGRAAKA
jgi:exosortase